MTTNLSWLLTVPASTTQEHVPLSADLAEAPLLEILVAAGHPGYCCRRTPTGDTVAALVEDAGRLTAERAALLAPAEGVDLEEVLRLDREGTPGPWHMRAAETENGYGTHAVSPDSAIEDGLSPTDLVLVGRTITIGVSGHDAALIATYRTAAPALAREVARLRALLGAEQTRAETYNEENREVVRALEDAGQLRAGKDSVAAVRALHAEVQRLQAERDRLDALAAGLFDGVPTSPENALTWLHQEVMRTLTTPNWPGVLVEILLERVRQIEKGYDAAHDDKLTAFELSTVAAAVTLGTVEHLPVSGDARELTGHIIEKWDIRRRLVIAAALVVAEIERLDRKQGGRTT